MSTSGTSPAGRSRPGWWPRLSDAAEQHGPIAHALFRISRKNRAMAGDMLRPLGLFPGQELLLLQLTGREPCSQNEIVEALGIDHSTVSKMLTRLERGGIVQRGPSPHDGRVVLVGLTEEGRARAEAVQEMWAELERCTVAGLSERQRSQLQRLLATVEAALDAER